MDKKNIITTFKSDTKTTEKIDIIINQLKSILGFQISKSAIIRKAILDYNFEKDIDSLRNNPESGLI